MAEKQHTGLARVVHLLLTGLYVALPVYVILSIYLFLDPLQSVAIFVLMIMLMVYLRDFLKEERSKVARSIDLSLAAVTLVVFGYPTIYHQTIVELAGNAQPFMVLFAMLSIALTLDATRRTLGWPLTIIVSVFVVYVFLGQYLPRDVGGHGGYSVGRIATSMYLGTNGIYGVVSSTLFNFVVLFVLFGKVLEAVGALRFIENFATALVGRFTGGPALVSVVSSGMMGSVTGSAVANVMVTGSVTIPLMKRLGFKPQTAAGVEASASTGGQFMPPVMGAAAFLMAQFVGVSYLTVITAALIPALLYFFGVMLGTYIMARNQGLEGLPKEERPKVMDTLKDPGGLIFVAGIGSLLYFLITNVNAMLSAVYAIVIMIVLYVVFAKERDLRKVAETVPETSKSFLDISIAGPSVGLVVSTLLLTGLGTRSAAIIFGLVGEELIPVLLITMVVAIILGVGLPTSVTYILTAIMIAPVIITLGVTPIAAHMFLFYMGMMSMITPPVALAAYAAASIAGTDFWRTGVVAFKLSLPAFLLPFAFVLDSALLLDGSSAMRVAFATGSAAVGVAALTLGLFGRRGLPERAMLLIAAGALITPGRWGDVIGVGLLVLGNLRPTITWLANRRDRSKALDRDADPSVPDLA